MNDMVAVENDSQVEAVESTIIHDSSKQLISDKFYKSQTVFDEVTLKALSSSSTVSENLNGGQIQTLLNGFLYRALCIAIKHTRMFDDFSVYLVYYLINVKKRRITYIDKSIAINRLILLLFTNNKQCKYKLLKSLGIERYYLSRYLSFCQNKINTCFEYLKQAYIAEHNEQTHKNLRNASLNIGISVLNIHEVYEKLRFYIDCYIQYRQQVISHYYKLCHKKARKQYKEKNNSSFDLHEIYQNYLLAVAKAIDKYDARRGAMTSYINWWILNVSTCDYSHYEYGIAYQIPSSYRRDMANHRVNQSNFSVSLENLVSNNNGNSAYGSTESTTYLKDTLIAENSDHAQQFEEEDYRNRFKRLLKASDPTGLARIYLGIEEVFSEAEKDRMQKHMNFLRRKLS